MKKKKWRSIDQKNKNKNRAKSIWLWVTQFLHAWVTIVIDILAIYITTPQMFFLPSSTQHKFQSSLKKHRVQEQPTISSHFLMSHSVRRIRSIVNHLYPRTSSSSSSINSQSEVEDSKDSSTAAADDFFIVLRPPVVRPVDFPLSADFLMENGVGPWFVDRDGDLGMEFFVEQEALSCSSGCPGVKNKQN